MASSLWNSLSIIQDGKTIKASQIFQIEAEQNHTFRNMLDVFSESENIDAEVKYFVVFIRY